MLNNSAADLESHDHEQLQAKSCRLHESEQNHRTRNIERLGLKHHLEARELLALVHCNNSMRLLYASRGGLQNGRYV